MSIETILELPVRPGDEARVVELFRELGIFDLAARNEGFLGARLCLPDRAGEQLVVIARWTDEAAIRRWVDDPERVRTNAVLAPHLVDYGFVRYLMGRGFKVIEVPVEEYWDLAVNAVTLEPGKVIMNAGAPTTVKALEKEGVEVIQVDFSESHKFAIAGLHCATMELVRDQL